MALAGLFALGILSAAPETVDDGRVLSGGAATGIQIDGTVTCPAPADVTSRLRRLVSADRIGQAGDRVRLDRGEGVLRVALVRADGQLRGLRNIDLGHDCDELAEAAAIIVASWQTSAPPPPAMKETAWGAARGDDDGAAGTSPMLGSRPTLAPPAGVRANAPAPEPNRTWYVDLGLGVAGAATTATTAGAIAPGLIFEGTLSRPGGGLGLHLRGLVTARHAQPLSNGEVNWRRWPIALGPSWQWRPGRISLECDVSAAAGWLHVEGDGFAQNEGHHDLDLGSIAGTRLGLGHPRPGAWRPWVGLAAAFWPRRTAVYQLPDLGRSFLPRWQGLVEIGVGRESR